MSRDALQRTVAWCGALLLCALVLQRYRAAGGPYFRWPATVLAHVYLGRHPQQHELEVVPKLEPLIPRGAQVTCFHPRDGQAWNDDSTYFTAIGLLPRNEVLPPVTAMAALQKSQLVEWVIAIDAPFTDSRYLEIATTEHGWLYHKH